MNSSASFYWHDYETFGSNPTSDRPAQFAGIRTDCDLNVVGDPLVLYSRPANDFLPHPEACLVTGLTPQKALEKGVPECEFIRRINEELSVAGTCGVGFNSIRFDDEVTRFTLYRNFFDAYAREWQQGNSRWDMIDVFRAAEALRPAGIEWPKREDGYTSFRLEDLTKENGIEHTEAHDALADVKATISLAGLLREKQPKLYDYAFAIRSKKSVSRLININDPKPILLISGSFGAKRHNAGLVLPLQIDASRTNEVLCFDLSCDPLPFMDLSVDSLVGRFYNQKPNDDKPNTELGLKKIYLNRCPLLVTTKILDGDLAARIGIDLDSNIETSRVLKSWCGRYRAQSQEKCEEIFRGRSFQPSTDPDKMLYSGGFFNDSDKRVMQKVHSTSVTDLESATFIFEDARLPEMLKRYRARNYPETLSALARAEWEKFRRKRIIDPDDGTSLSLSEFLALIEIKIACKNTKDEHRIILDQLKAYADALLR